MLPGAGSDSGLVPVQSVGAEGRKDEGRKMYLVTFSADRMGSAAPWGFV